MTKIKKYNELADDISALAKLEDGEYQKITTPIEIIQFNGIITDEAEIEKIEENITFDTSLTVKNVKRGDTIWLSALLQKSDKSAWNSQVMGVVKVRVVDVYYGLNKINQVK